MAYIRRKTTEEQEQHVGSNQQILELAITRIGAIVDTLLDHRSSAPFGLDGHRDLAHVARRAPDYARRDSPGPPAAERTCVFPFSIADGAIPRSIVAFKATLGLVAQLVPPEYHRNVSNPRCASKRNVMPRCSAIKFASAATLMAPGENLAGDCTAANQDNVYFYRSGPEAPARAKVL